jgi:23S rRNA pseudouridine1911/1915/1917 synthase
VKRWVVREGDGELDAIVLAAGGDAAALEEGRVFIGRRRAKRRDAVHVGDEIRVNEPSSPPSDAPGVTVLHHGAGIVAVSKPAGISTIPDQKDAASSLLHETARLVGVWPDLLHATSRLDRGVSGVVIFTESDEARSRLQEARSAGAYHRRYVALTAKAPLPPTGTWEARIGRASDPRRRKVNGRNATNAETRYALVAQTPHAAMLSIEPMTGRTHQIRVHAAHASVPLIGDRDYGGPRTVTLPSGKVLACERVALHCLEVRVVGLTLRAGIPEDLRAWWRSVSGSDADWPA